MKMLFWSLFISVTLLTACTSGGGGRSTEENSEEPAQIQNSSVTPFGGIPCEALVKADAPPPDPKTSEEKGLWNQILSIEQRFQLALNGEGVLDRETGLVWEKTPDVNSYKWADIAPHCYKLFKGGRWGWRLPSMEELASLGDANSALPRNAPFQNSAPNSTWWSATTDPWDANSVFSWSDSLGVGNSDKKDLAKVWCVRGK